MIKFPVVVLNGFLGSGKTTLFRNLISQSIKKDITDILDSVYEKAKNAGINAEILYNGFDETILDKIFGKFVEISLILSFIFSSPTKFIWTLPSPR